MRNSWAILALGAVMATAVLAGTPSAMAQQSPDAVRIDVTLNDADMVAATQAITKRTGLQFFNEPSAEPFKRVTLSLKGVSAEEAVKYICNASGAFFRRDENGVYIISSTKPAEPVVVGNTTTTSGKAVKFTKRIKCRNTDPKSVYDTLMYQAPMTAGNGSRSPQ